MTDIDHLRAEYLNAEADAQSLTAEKDRIRDELRAVNERAATLQKQLSDAEATHALSERDDLSDDEKAETAARLGLEFPA